VKYAVLLLTLIALALRLYCLDCYGLWYDEVASVEIAGRGPWAILTDRFGGMLVQTPLHYLLVWLTALPIDPAESAVPVRSTSVLAGALAVPVLYGLGREMFGRGAGLLAALLVAVSPVHVGHSQDVRPYALLVLFSSLSVYTLVRAEKGGGARWWWAFAGATIATLYISYFGLTLFLPALAPFVAWVLWRALRRGGAPLRPGLLSLALVAVASIPIVLDVLRVERTPPDLSLLSFKLLFDQLALLPTSLAKVGLGGEAEIVVQWILFALAALGALAGLIAGRTRYVALCALMLVVPALELALFRTTNQVFQRYAVFALPFYLLLISTGVAGLWAAFRRRSLEERRPAPATPTHASPIAQYASRLLVGAVGAGVLLLFVLGTYFYFKPEEHRRFSYLPDYRGAARFVAEQADDGDLVVLVDEPALGAEVMDFYWRGAPPALVRDARDPRLGADMPSGDVYWVVSFYQNDPSFLRDFAESSLYWEASGYFDRIVVLRERRRVVPVEALAILVEKLRGSVPEFQPVRTLRGVVLQAEGQAVEAAALYSQAGAYFPRLGAEFLVSAQGYLDRGERARAWREALTSLFMQPGDPRIHTLLTRLLAEEGYAAQSQVSRQVAESLERR
jgi:4-amino-4-deoxy-L-arabinose transferase-like glycosyltransferase